MSGDLGVIFVNHHSEALISPRVDRLLEAGLDTVVVDNSGSYRGPGRVIDAGANLGFGAACNLGERELGPGVDRVCLHNPDVDSTVDALRQLGDRLRAHRYPGAVAPAVRDAAILRPAGYRYPSASRELVLAAGVRRRRSTTKSHVGPTAGRRFGTAALLVVDREAWHTIGGFDERFFLYAEDLDLWHRLRTTSRWVGFADDVVVDHAQGEGSHLGRSKRELLRWVGVELFAATSGVDAWREWRRIPRAPLVRHHRRAPALAAELALGFHRGDDPETIARHLRAGLADGSLLAEASVRETAV